MCQKCQGANTRGGWPGTCASFPCALSAPGSRAPSQVLAEMSILRLRLRRKSCFVSRRPIWPRARCGRKLQALHVSGRPLPKSAIACRRWPDDGQRLTRKRPTPAQKDRARGYVGAWHLPAAAKIAQDWPKSRGRCSNVDCRANFGGRLPEHARGHLLCNDRLSQMSPFPEHLRRFGSVDTCKYFADVRRHPSVARSADRRSKMN